MYIAVSQSSRFESIWQLISVSIIFLIVLGLSYFTTKWISKIQKKQSFNKNIEVIETFKITTNKYIQIIRTGEKYLVIAIAKDNISMLTELTEQQLNLTMDEEVSKETFGEILNRMKDLKHKK
ncbi:flagellar biosynthetic protein FliO [Candidatus Galacturonibacter soehngenii]|uniref:Flagellar biosynthetic protein FliO n=1 Tax=Candidatus Galacturonatibacter soehngenii TaxID=2307010 RepID=A0A7V7QJD9_9FIRM|nr:flagellar biosynthetic protein FliO [Candidatus Galacturonibacter soehngenii]KAB1437695.1 flagellar biosynthetic protein FliO [Candidatus Galacturonibacter soehngenii]MBA4686926.1 flagellar biosynthetic protein FliO [Candidatus Galacturonibacter soehngenii]